MTKVERRKETLINAAFYILILGAFYLFMKYAFSIFSPFIIAFFVAMLLQKPVNYVVKKTPLKKGLASAIFVLIALAVFATLIAAVGTRIVMELKGLGNSLVAKLDELPNTLQSLETWLLAKIKFLPGILENTIADSIRELFLDLQDYATSETATDPATTAERLNPFRGLLASFDISILSTPLSGVWSTAKQIPSILIAGVITVVSCCFMTSGYDDIVNFIKLQLSTSKRFALSSTKGIFFSSLAKMLKAYIIIIFITFCEMFVGLFLLKLLGFYESDYIIALSLVVAVVDIFPVLGTGTIIVPWAIYSLLSREIGLGIGLLIIYAAISVIRQVIEPKLVASNLGMSPIITIMCMYVGLQVFGFIGIFLLPLLVILLTLLNDEGIIHLWRTNKVEKPLKTEEFNNK